MFKVLAKPDTYNLSMCVEYSKTTTENTRYTISKLVEGEEEW